MQEYALGFVETIGFIPAVEAADAGVKAADVALVSVEKSGSGLVAILFTGGVSSVQAAVDCAVGAAQRVGIVSSSTVIARQGEGLADIITPLQKSDNTSKETLQKESIVQQAPQENDSFFNEAAEEPDEDSTEEIAGEEKRTAEIVPAFSASELRRKRVVELREILHRFAGERWSVEQIDRAVKRDLIGMVKMLMREQS